VPDYSAEGTMRPEAAELGSPEKPVAGEHPARDPLTRCPSCGAEVVPREASYGADEEPSVGLACPSCGAVIEPFE
jgi:predicted RNA-binding Zn-ribbon protein involved in translation (DUF1610 family)